MYNENMDVAYDLYEEAMEKSSKVEKRKILKQALKLYPEFYDCELAIINLVANNEKAIEELVNFEARQKEILTNDGDYQVGYFWGIIETRAYMRGLYSLVERYTLVGEYKKALEVAEQMLILCPGDNIGMRYKLLALYILADEKTKAKKYLTEYKENSLTYLVNKLAYLLHIKDEVNIIKVLKQIEKIDDVAFELLTGLCRITPKDIKEVIAKGRYSFGSPEELIIALYTLPKPIIDSFKILKTETKYFMI